MHLTLTGLSHKTAPVEIREKLSFPPELHGDALEKILSNSEIKEAAIISTCNRTEIYGLALDHRTGIEKIVNFLTDFHRLDPFSLNGHIYSKHSIDVARHLFSVSSSLDSMIVGEAQILGQVKEAFSLAVDNKSAGMVLNRLFREAITIGKKVRTETDIGESAVSISYAAVELAKHIFDTLENKTVLIVGAGEMSELTAKHLVANGVSDVIVVNRTFERAEELAKKFDGRSASFDEMKKSLESADIVISSTGAPGIVIDKQTMTEAMKKRKNKPVFLIDIAVPRDIDPEINNLYNAYLYDIDDLQDVVKTNIENREQEAEKAKIMIDNAVESFSKWLATLEVVPTITDLKNKAERIKEQELSKAVTLLGDKVDESQIKTMDAMAQAIINKLLHEPIVKLKDAAGENNGNAYLKTFRTLFKLDEKK